MSVYWRLIRPGLLSMVLASMAAAALMSGRSASWPGLAYALFGTAMLIAGASAANQLIERRSDARMARTASRPLPSGRASAGAVAIFSLFCSFAGIGLLAVLQPLTLTLLAALSWCVYVLLYTPLKRISFWHVPIGAVAGAMPVLLGAATIGAAFEPLSLTLFGLVFFWQFPHTSAVGWLHREQYAQSETKVAAVVDPSGKLAGRMALAGAAGLLLTSVAPTMQASAGWPYFAAAVSLGLAGMSLATRFLANPTDAAARAMWRMSLVHLPALLSALLIDRFF